MIKIIREEYHQVRLSDLKVGDKCVFDAKWPDSDGNLVVSKISAWDMRLFENDKMVIPCGPSGELPDGEIKYGLIEQDFSGAYFYRHGVTRVVIVSKSFSVEVGNPDFVPEYDNVSANPLICLHASVWTSSKGIHWAPVRGFK